MATLFPKIIIITGPEEGKEFELTSKESFIIGRSQDCDIILDDSSLSRNHASLHLQNNTWIIRDEGSRNGTFINNQKIDTASSTPITHLDVIKMGLYEIRLALQEFTEDEVKETPLATDQLTQTQEDIKAQDAERITLNEDEVLDEIAPTDLEELQADKGPYQNEESEITKQRTGKSLLIFTMIALSFCVLGFVLFITYNKINKKEDIDTEIAPDDDVIEEVVETEPFDSDQGKPDTDIEKTPEVEPKPEPEEDQNHETETEKIPEPEPEVTFTPISLNTEKPSADSNIKDFVVILDAKTEPLPATIYFKDERVCTTPCRKQIMVSPNTQHTLYADFDLRELNDIYRKKIDFKVKPDIDVLEMTIRADIASMKILRIPRRAEFYLEGYYDYDKLKAKPAKITNLVYGKPIFLPYGTYHVELREKIKVSGSNNPITQIRYERKHILNKENPVLEMNINEKDFGFFPAIIKSNPTGAAIFFAGEKVGTTPFTGRLPLGSNQLKVTKEGFFAHITDIEMRFNSVYETNIELKTSKMGELINEAKEQIRNEQKQNAIELLISALKFGGSAREKAEVYYLLGTVYNQQKNYTQAIPYLDRARSHKDFKHRAAIQQVRSYQGQNNKVGALKMIVEVLANINSDTPVETRIEANSVFKLLSPVKSVMYIYTEPAGARVFINDNLVHQNTPLILSDLGLGNYRLQIEKNGYETYKSKQNIKIGEFVMIKIRLKGQNL
jgi:pSer/pThr/pTyr-binding forkhead associated (FHA) protein/tetratricopeptide (TPR) repeat protein